MVNGCVRVVLNKLHWEGSTNIEPPFRFQAWLKQKPFLAASMDSCSFASFAIMVEASILLCAKVIAQWIPRVKGSMSWLKGMRMPVSEPSLQEVCHQLIIVAHDTALPLLEPLRHVQEPDSDSSDWEILSDSSNSSFEPPHTGVALERIEDWCASPNGRHWRRIAGVKRFNH